MKSNIFHSAALIAAIAACSAVSASEPITLRGAELFDQGVIPAVISVDMSTLPPYRGWKPGEPIKEIPQRKGVPRDFVAPIPDRQPDAPSRLRALNDRMPQLSGGAGFDAPLINRDGSGFSGVNPPDTIGDVGNEYFIQMINGSGASGGTRVLILDKSDGSAVPNGSFGLGSLATGSGTGCTNGGGDPIVMFDETVDNGVGQPAGRWFLSEFTNNSFCVYISQTSDPTAGDWFLYEFTSASGALPDYPKWAVWPDAYYLGANENAGNIPGAGRTVYAFDRENMLLGAETRPAQVFEAPPLAGFGFQMLQPADWDGRLAPPGNVPGLFLRHRDDEVHNAGSSDPTQDFLEIWEFRVDWDNDANSTFTGPTNLGVEDFESELCGLSAFECVPQPDTGTGLDPLREPVMWRAQYRNFGPHQSIVATWVTDAEGGSADLHGVRWAELRNTGPGWNLYQDGLVAPDSVNRWMSSIAMDGTGNIALGYNVSDGSTTFPGLRYIGRLVGDALDTMPRGEFSLIEGSGSNASIRYGDYSAMTVDPVDECTFWFTGEYNTSSQWSTRIGAFRFDACGEPGFFLDPSPAVGGVCTLPNGGLFASTINVGSVSDFVDPVTLSFDSPLPPGFTPQFGTQPVTPGDSSFLNLIVDDTVSAGDYAFTLLGTAAGADDQTAALAIAVDDVPPSGNSTSAPANGTSDVGLQPLLEWTAATSVDLYSVLIATDADFHNVVYSASEAGTTHQVETPLDFSTEYFWRVTPFNFCGPAPATPVSSFTTQAEPGACPIDEIVLTVFEDDMENGANGWTLGDDSVQNTWQQTTTNPFSGSTAWNAENVGTTSDQRLDSPTIQLPPASATPLTLRFQNFQEIEDDEGFGGPGCWDAASIEISTDGGSSWTQLQDQILFREYDFVVNAATSNPLSGSPGWCGDPRDYEDYVVDLSSFAGEDVQFRFRVGTDGSVGPPREGWTIDDVRVEACGTELLFSNGFETLPPP